MTEIGANAIFSGPQKGLTVIGKHCYGYSGIVGVTNVETDLFDFSTGKDYISSNLQVLNGTDSNEDFLYKVYFNDVLVAQWHFLYASTIHQTLPNAYKIIIPPNTTVRVTGANTISGTSRNHSATITGKVYE